MDNRLQFRFARPVDETPAIPASLLIETLEGAQRAIWLIALAKEQKDIRSRARIPAEIERRYQLKCAAPVAGSYVIPAFVESDQPQLPALDQIAIVLDTFEAVASGLQSSDRDAVARHLPDTGIRRRVVDAFRQLAPKPGSGWRLEVSRNGTMIRMDHGWQRSLRRMYAYAEAEPDRETVNGDLIEINFVDRQLTIRPIGSNRSLEITYPEDMEDTLLENRKSRIQVTGRVLRDGNNELKSMFDLEAIGPLDLSPLEVSDVEYGGVRLHFKEALRLYPRLSDDSPQYLIVEDSRLGLDAFAGTVSDLVDEVAESLVVGWKQYALAKDNELAPKAQELKRSLLAAMEEVPVGG